MVKKTCNNVTPLLVGCVIVLMLLSAGSFGSAGNGGQSTAPTITLTVLDVTTEQQISSGETITAGNQFQATVTVTDNIDCAGQVVVTAIGAPGAPPEVIVAFNPFIIGPNSGIGDSFTGPILTSNGTPGHPNHWKISASCNGVAPNAFGFAHFQFTSAVS